MDECVLHPSIFRLSIFPASIFRPFIFLSSLLAPSIFLVCARYWRTAPQPYNSDPWHFSPFYSGVRSRPFVGTNGFCEAGDPLLGESQDFTELCLTPGCGPPLIEEIVCTPYDDDRGSSYFTRAT